MPASGGVRGLEEGASLGSISEGEGKRKGREEDGSPGERKCKTQLL